MSDTLAHRLGVRSGDRLLVLNAPERYLRLLQPPEGVHIDLGALEGARYDGVHFFALDRGTVTREVPEALDLVGPRTRLWLCYPQRGGTIITDLTADRGWKVLEATGWHRTVQVPIDTDWAALRFEPSNGS
ncbi:hypothetical protein [Nocardiopsis sp. CNT312]|uniref:hypothetical protein n=1 Tax=Nocardiopsis sp. CNT312 TaxID=1137268 RepID=UPI00048DE70B|nr:hypothetical protein [Nocardiopsis sp. CNT312]